MLLLNFGMSAISDCPFINSCWGVYPFNAGFDKKNIFQSFVFVVLCYQTLWCSGISIFTHCIWIEIYICIIISHNAGIVFHSSYPTLCSCSSGRQCALIITQSICLKCNRRPIAHLQERDTGVLLSVKKMICSLTLPLWYCVHICIRVFLLVDFCNRTFCPDVCERYTKFT